MSEPNSAKANRRAEEEKARKERRKYNLIVIITLAVLAAAVVFVILFNSNLFYNITTAVEINGVDFTVADFNYNYFSAYNSTYNMYAQYGLSSLMPTAGTPLDEQVFSTSKDGEEITWADYFEDQALTLMRQTAMLCTAAENDPGFSLSQEEKDSIDAAVESTRTQAASYGYPNLKAYLSQIYGKGMTEEVFRRNIERQTIANAYSAYKQESFTYTADELAAHYAENADQYDFFLYRSYRFSGAAVTDDTETEEDETLSLDDAMAKAEADAKAFDAAVTDEQTFIDYAASLNGDNEDYDADESTYYELQGASAESSLAEDAFKWLTDPARKNGDHTVIGTAKDASSPGFYVLYFISRDNNQYSSANGWYGFIPVDEDVIEEGADLTDEEKAEDIRTISLIHARDVLNEYTSGTEKGVEAFDAVMGSEANAELVTSHGELAKFGRYDMPEDLRDWFFDPARQEGDTEAIFVEDSGTYILYFAGLDEVYADVMADAAMRSDDMDAWGTEQLQSFTAEKQWEMVLSKKLPSLS